MSIIWPGTYEVFWSEALTKQSWYVSLLIIKTAPLATVHWQKQDSSVVEIFSWYTE